MPNKVEIRNTVRKAIIWDWNGTLLDDIDICIQGINTYLKVRNLEMMNKKKYREIFNFPIKDYYSQIGFDFKKESFEELSAEFLKTYFANFKHTKLFKDAEVILSKLYKKGYYQYALSAMDQISLVDSIRKFGIHKYFNRIVGANNILAKGKSEYGYDLMFSENLIPGRTCLIGDTLHDQEVADQLKIPCILVSIGHQTHKRLAVNGNFVVKSLQEALKAVYNIL